MYAIDGDGVSILAREPGADVNAKDKVHNVVRLSLSCLSLICGGELLSYFARGSAGAPVIVCKGSIVFLLFALVIWDS